MSCSVGTLEITLSFTRKTGESEWEDFHHSFTSDESLEPILEKMEMFLQQLGFVVDGRRLTLERVRKEAFDSDSIVGYSDNVKPFPTPSNQE